MIIYLFQLKRKAAEFHREPTPQTLSIFQNTADVSDLSTTTTTTMMVVLRLLQTHMAV